MTNDDPLVKKASELMQEARLGKSEADQAQSSSNNIFHAIQPTTKQSYARI